MPIELLFAFGSGFLSWFATGLDDLFLLIGLLKGNSGKKAVYIALGQLTGITLLLIVANILPLFITLPESIGGIGLIVAGVLIYKSSGEPFLRKSHWVFLTALLTYLSFAADDLLVATASMISLEPETRLVFSVGFVTGWIISFVLALAGAQIKSNWAEKILPLILILLGLSHLIPALY